MALTSTLRLSHGCRRFVRMTLAVSLCCAATCAFAASAAPDLDANPNSTQTPGSNPDIFPPWQHGANNDAVNRGMAFTVPQVDVLADFHGDLTAPKLVLYVGGNYFFAMAPLVARFEQDHPEFRGRIYWETIPPGLLVEQIKAGGTITVGNMTWTVRPDAYFAGLAKVKALIADGTLAGPAVPYVTNQLTIMVRQGNPQHVRSLNDLGKPELRLAMPNPAFEGVTRQIDASLVKAGGEALASTVYGDKVRAGSTELTHIHHREIALFLMQGRADAGVVWKSEALFQEQIGHPLQHVDIPAAENTTAIYAGAVVRGAAHPRAARQWLAFLRSPEAFGIFQRYGFGKYDDAAANASAASLSSAE
ncbi:substrate-binding domain-containing protein [Paraburkholderia bryophila]|uniref:ABC-type molybdate transport system substrate-binding protein n=1 Tax=Paraburkholderia bryophila TaxID=420952 RepID=A0A329CWC8_9BURK|nr:substrate-binding domain-containing protein [Paraburkholderia bryophila]RAS38730.1 ABC-type molybdate transport system substrate-binding protein [Paraburkholderia bryophila]